MGLLNVEIKAVCRDAEAVRRVLRRRRARFLGMDRQVDTYFRVLRGRLKLREGRLENHLIWYARVNKRGPRPARILLCATQPGSPLKGILAEALGVLAVVDKRREIYFIGNVKFHIDQVDGLGSFVEIEAQSAAGSVPEDRLRDQCRRYMRLLGIRRKDLLGESYGDMALRNSAKGPRRTAGPARRE